MIRRFTDHSANERTYLAWIRTAIAIMAFGFLVEKFELFVSYLGLQIDGKRVFSTSPSAQIVGLGLLFIGVAIIIGSTVRFFLYRNAIDSERALPYGARRPNLLLAVLMVLLGIFLLVYMGHQVISNQAIGV
jgi:putative membrane protein